MNVTGSGPFGRSLYSLHTLIPALSLLPGEGGPRSGSDVGSRRSGCIDSSVQPNRKNFGGFTSFFILGTV